MSLLPDAFFLGGISSLASFPGLFLHPKILRLRLISELSWKQLPGIQFLLARELWLPSPWLITLVPLENVPLAFLGGLQEQLLSLALGKSRCESE